MIETSEKITTLAAALLKAQAQMHGAKKDAKNPHFRSSYATLETVIETAKPALQSVGIAFTQAPGCLVDGALEVTTMLIHAESGEWMRSTLHVPLQKKDPQGVGSAITYACRYSLMATLGLPPVDDDGESAMDRKPQQQTKQATASKNDETRKLYSALERSMRENTTPDDLRSWWQDSECKSKRDQLPDDWRKNLYDEFVALGKSFSEQKDAA